MIGWGLLVPKGWMIGAWMGASMLIGVQFADTITVGAIITAALVVILGGVFTLRNNMRSFWRGLAEERAAQITSLEHAAQLREERVKELQEQARDDLAAFAEEQRAVRHDLKNQVNTLNAQLQVAQSRTDLTSLLEQLASQHSEAMEKITKGLEFQARILNLIEGAGSFVPKEKH